MTRRSTSSSSTHNTGKAHVNDRHIIYGQISSDSPHYTPIIKASSANGRIGIKASHLFLLSSCLWVYFFTLGHWTRTRAFLNVGHSRYGLVERLGSRHNRSAGLLASTTLIFHDWFLTSYEELTFVWRRGGNLYVRILFVGARYTALACALLYWFPVSPKVGKIVTWLDVVVVICSELIFVLRTWAIWERSRPILVFLIGLTIAFAVLSILVIEFPTPTALVTSSITVIFEGAGQYKIPTSTVQYAWFASTPFLLLLVLQSSVLALTSYRVLRYRSNHSMRSTLMDVLWIEGITYFVFMFIVGALNIGLIMNVSHPQLQFGLLQFQMVLHSILSTRVVLHTATVLKQEIVDSRATVARNRRSSSMRFAEVTIELVSEDVGPYETRRQQTNMA